MGFLDSLLGRTKPVRPNLDVLFAVPSAALTLQAASGFAPTGVGSVCFKSPEGMAAEQAQREIGSLLSLDQGSTAQVSVDGYGFTWVTCRRPDGDLSALVTDLHAVNTTLDDAGFGPALLCTVIAFAKESEQQQGMWQQATHARGRPLGLVYLYKRGTFYPFAPAAGQKRDTELELRVRGMLEGELPVESDLGRWFPIWDAPGL
ncbi:MAG: hypothetical protein QOE61_4181 [Micromonosporaceae bacterium]|nr:hypothetical protein [Micromonosporaceae bacterium]